MPNEITDTKKNEKKEFFVALKFLPATAGIYFSHVTNHMYLGLNMHRVKIIK